MTEAVIKNRCCRLCNVVPTLLVVVFCKIMEVLYTTSLCLTPCENATGCKMVCVEAPREGDGITVEAHATISVRACTTKF